MRKIIGGMLMWCLFISWGWAANDFSLNVEGASLSDVLQVVADAIPLSMTLSPRVRGRVSVHWNHVNPLSAFQLLLRMNGLKRESYQGLWYVAPADELIEQANRDEKWTTAQEAALPLLTHVYQIRYTTASALADFLQSGKQTVLSKRGVCRVDVRTNTLLVTDIALRLQYIDDWVHRLDVPLKQILIEARLASVDQDAESALGIDFSTYQNAPKTELGRYSLAIAHLADGSKLDVKLAALERAGKANLMASPRLFTVNLREALIESGEEVPYHEESESGGTIIAFKKAVLGLQVLPQVLPGGEIRLSLKINQDRPLDPAVTGVPYIDTREIHTEVLVKHGQTVVLGGIYEDNREAHVDRLPYLSALPLVGRLFQTKVESNRRRELLIFVTPKLIA